jgi:transcriptional regulator with XRE-family HTH domain
MDDLKVGTLGRVLRHRLGLTQRQLGARAGVSQQLVSLFERGYLDRLTVRAVRRIGAAFEMQLPFEARWRGSDGVRLLDAEHAALVNHCVRVLNDAGWQTVVEFTFSVYGERGSVDVIGWHESSRVMLIIEVKSRLLDSQGTLATLDRKVRLIPSLLARNRGWTAMSVGALLVMPGLTANRSAVSRHAATFDSALPARGQVIRQWLRWPSGPMAGVWFLSSTNGVSGVKAGATRRRVRVAGSSSPPLSQPPSHQPRS